MAMARVSLRNLDLNLLVAFSVLMREKNVSRAAKVLGIGQSGMSGMLARLRDSLGDPLLVRVGRQLQATPRALALAGHVDEALAILERGVGHEGRFDAQDTTRTFVAGLGDAHEILLAGALVEVFAREAPRARLVLRPVDAHTYRTALDDGSVDLALAVATEDLSSWHDAEDLFAQGYTCIWSPKQLGTWTKLTLERFLSAPHALVTPAGDLVGAVDAALAARGLSRDVVVGVPRFGALPSILAARPLFASVPDRIAQLFVERHGLSSAPLPVTVEPRTTRLLHRRRDANLRELVWFRDLVRRIARGAAGRRPSTRTSTRRPR